MVRIWEADWRKVRRLNPIVPIVVYPGDEPWREAVGMEVLIDGPEVFRAYVSAFGHHLHDLSKMEDWVLWHEVVIGAWLGVLKYIRHPDFESRLEYILHVRGFARRMCKQSSELLRSSELC